MTARPDGVVAAGAGAPGRGRSLARIVLWVLCVLLVGFCVVLAAAVWVVGHLDHPVVKARVRAALHDAGLDADYGTFSVSLLGGRIAGTKWVLAQPAPFQKSAPPALVLDAWSLQWEPRALLRGRVQGVRAEFQGLALTYAADATTDTLSQLGGSRSSTAPVAPAAQRALSHSLEPLEASGVAIERLTVAPISLNYVEFAGGTLQRSAHVEGLGIDTRIKAQGAGVDGELRLFGTGAHGQARIAVHDVSGAAGGQGTAREALDARAQLELAAMLRLRPAQPVTCSLSVRASDTVGVQVPPSVPLDATLEAAVGFDPARGRTGLELRTLRAFGDAISAQLSSKIDDAQPDALYAVNGQLTVDGARLPPPPAGLELEGFRLELTLKDAAFSHAGYSGQVQGRLAAQRLARSASGTVTRAERVTAELASAQLTSAPAPSAPAAPEPLHVVLRAQRLSSEAQGSESEPAATLEARDCTLSLEVPPSLLSQAPAASPAASLDEFSLHCADLSRAAGHATMSVHAPALQGRGKGLFHAVATNAATFGTVSFQAARVQSRDAASVLEVAPCAADFTADGLRMKGSGLFGLGGRASLDLQLGATQREANRAVELAQSSVKLSADFDRNELKASWPLPHVRAREGRRTSWSLDGADFDLVVADLSGASPQDMQGHARLAARVARLESQGTTLSLPDVAFTLEMRKAAYSLHGGATFDRLRAGRESALGAHRFEFEADADLPRAELTLAAHLHPSDASAATRTLPAFDLNAHAQVDRKSGTFDHRIKVDAERLAPLLARAVPAPTHAAIGQLHIEAEGRLAGLFAAGSPPSQLPVVAREVRVRGEEHARLELDDLELQRADQATLRCPKLTLGVQLHPKGSGAHATFDLLVPSASFRQDAMAVAIAGFHPRVELELPDTSKPAVATIDLSLDIDRIDQPFSTSYPAAGLRMQAKAETADGRIEVRGLKLSNPATRTEFSTTLHYESERASNAPRRLPSTAASIEGRTAFSLEGELVQELAPFAKGAFFSQASGRLRVPFSLRSGDLRSFRMAARIIAEGVDITSADQAFSIERLNGEIPIDETLLSQDSGFALGSETRPNALSRARFPDVQPYLNNDAYVTAERFAMGKQTFGPLAGNMRVSGTTFSVDRLQLGYRGGAVTGQLEADWKRGASRLTFRGNATGIHTEHGGSDVLDANLALQFVPESLALDGSAQLVRLSKTHVIELLDALDPFHEDPRMNKTRSLLAFGYPRFARLRASEGLMDFELSLGGLAGAVSIDPIRAIPIAPLLDVYVAPIIDPLFPRDAVRPRKAGEHAPRAARHLSSHPPAGGVP